MKFSLLIFFSFTFAMFSYGQFEESEAIDAIFEEWNKTDAPGCGLGIIKDGKMIYGRGYGMANLEYDIPNSNNSVFRIGSTSKQFTAACIVLLAEKGKLNLDDKLNTFFPEFPEYAKKISVRHLLNHTSGVRDYLTISYLKGYTDDEYYTDEDLMKWLVNQDDLNFEPGEEFLYSNSGYWLLGQIVEKVSEKNMADYAKDELFTPLGMNNTHFHNNHNEIVKNRASGYTPTGENSY
ncbi:MAG: serine hydrolase domain-containing protein, partial [Flavobacteriales bacterium]